MKIITIIIMFAIGTTLMLVLDDLISGQIWLVGAVLLTWMPRDRLN